MIQVNLCLVTVLGPVLVLKNVKKKKKKVTPRSRSRSHTPAVHLCCNVKLNVWDRRTGRSLRSPNFVSIFPPFPPFFTMIHSLLLFFYVSTLNSTNLPIFCPHLCLVVDILALVLRLAPFRNFFALSLLQNDFQLDRLAKVM